MDPVHEEREVGARFAFLAIAAISALVYSIGLRGPFVFDDYQYIVENTHLRHSVRWFEPFVRAELLFAPMESLQYRPILFWFNRWNFATAGMDARGYHLANLAVHVLCTLLVGALANALARRCRSFPSERVPEAGAWAAALFAVHPAATEAVAYISGRSASLLTLSILAGSWLTVTSDRRPERAFLGAVAFGIAGFLHEAAFIAVFLVVGLTAMLDPPMPRHVDRKRIPLWLVRTGSLCLLPAVLIFGQLQIGRAMDLRYSQEADWASRMETVDSRWIASGQPEPRAAGELSEGQPLSVAAATARVLLSRSGAFPGFLALGFLTAALVAAGVRSRSDRSVAARIGWTEGVLVGCGIAVVAIACSPLFALSPLTKGLAQLPRYAILVFWPGGLNADPVVMGDRSPVLALAAFAVSAIALLLAVRLRIRRPLAAIGIVWFFLSLLPYAAHWGAVASDRRMYTALAGVAFAFADLVSLSPSSRWKRTRFIAAVALTACAGVSVGRVRLWSDPPALWADAVNKNPANYRARLNLALAEFRQGDLSSAEKNAQAALAGKSRFAEAHNLLGLVAMGRGSYTEAEARFRLALDGTLHCYPEAASNLGSALFARGSFTESAEWFRAALQCEGGRRAEIHLNLGLALERSGDRPGAERAIRQALEIDPQFAPASDALRSLAAGPATHN